MIYARQSTAITVTVGPTLDADGVAVTGGVVADYKISKNGGAPAALNGSATYTHRHTGYGSLALTATDVGTVGTVEITMDDTVNACPIKEITVLEEAVYDAMFAASALGYVANQPVDVNTIKTQAVTCAAGVTVSPFVGNATAAIGVNASGHVSRVTLTDTATVTTTATNLTNLPSIPANWLTAAGINDGAFTAAKFAAGAFDAVWSVAARILTAGTNIVLAKGTGVTGFNDLSAAQVESECNDALVALNLDHLLKNAVDTDFFTTVHLDSVLGHIVDGGGTNTFDRTTDSLEVLRDRGDAAWITATGFSTHSAADVVTALGDGSTLTEAGGTGDHLTALATAADQTAIKAKTDQLTFTQANVLDANIEYVNGTQVNGTGATGDEWGP
jgi:hypothetical protein